MAGEIARIEKAMATKRAKDSIRGTRNLIETDLRAVLDGISFFVHIRLARRAPSMDTFF